MSRIPVVAGSPQTVSASSADQKVIHGQVGTVAYSNVDGSGSLASGQSVTVANNTTLTVSSGKGYVTVLDVFGVPDTITEASLPDSVVSDTELRAQGYDTYDGKADGALVTADSGQTWTHNTTSTTGNTTEARLRIVDERLQQALTGTQRGNGYAQFELDGPVARIKCRFRFDGPSLSGSSLVVLAIWDRAIVAGDPDGIPNSPCHLTVTPAKWTYGYWDDTGGLELVDIMNGYWVDDLVSGEWYDLEALIDYEASTATIRTSVACTSPADQLDNDQVRETPDKLLHSIADPEIALHSGNWACFELTQAADPATTYKPSMTEVLADVA